MAAYQKRTLIGRLPSADNQPPLDAVVAAPVGVASPPPREPPARLVSALRTVMPHRAARATAVALVRANDVALGGPPATAKDAPKELALCAGAILGARAAVLLALRAATNAPLVRAARSGNLAAAQYIYRSRCAAHQRGVDASTSQPTGPLATALGAIVSAVPALLILPDVTDPAVALAAPPQRPFESSDAASGGADAAVPADLVLELVERVLLPDASERALGAAAAGQRVLYNNNNDAAGRVQEVTEEMERIEAPRGTRGPAPVPNATLNAAVYEVGLPVRGELRAHTAFAAARRVGLKIAVGPGRGATAAQLGEVRFHELVDLMQSKKEIPFTPPNVGTTVVATYSAETRDDAPAPALRVLDARVAFAVPDAWPRHAREMAAAAAGVSGEAASTEAPTAPISGSAAVAERPRPRVWQQARLVLEREWTVPAAATAAPPAATADGDASLTTGADAVPSGAVEVDLRALTLDMQFSKAFAPAVHAVRFCGRPCARVATQVGAGGGASGADGAWLLEDDVALPPAPSVANGFLATAMRNEPLVCEVLYSFAPSTDPASAGLPCVPSVALSWCVVGLCASGLRVRRARTVPAGAAPAPADATAAAEVPPLPTHVEVTARTWFSQRVPLVQ